MCGRVSDGPFARRAASTASSDARTARSPIAWKCGWNPSASSAGTQLARPSGSIWSRPAVVGRAAVAVAVRLEHRAGEVLEDAVHHQLHARRRVAPDRRRRAAARRTPRSARRRGGAPTTARPTTRPVSSPRRRERHVRALLGVRLDDGVLPGGDPELVEVALAEPQGLLEVGRRVVGHQPRDEVHGAFVERAARRAVGVALDPAVGGVGGRGRDPGQLERLRVDPRPVPIAVGQEDRAVGDDPVEVLAPRRPALERGHVPAAAADPRLVRVRSRRRPRSTSSPGPDCASVVEVAAEHRQPAVDRVDVGVLEARASPSGRAAR